MFTVSTPAPRGICAHSGFARPGGKPGAEARRRKACRRAAWRREAAGGEGVRTSSAVLLPHTPSSVAVARRRLVAELTAADVTGPAVGDAAVVISELVSNAVRHATPLTGSMIK